MQNRSFEDNESLIAWTPFAYSNAVTSSRAIASFALGQSSPLNASNPTSLKITIAKPCNGRVGVFNQGFKGIVAKGKFPETSAEWRQKFAEAQGEPVNGLAVSSGTVLNLDVTGVGGTPTGDTMGAALAQSGADATISVGSKIINGSNTARDTMLAVGVNNGSGTFSGVIGGGTRAI